jgi:hypothetical protein
MSLYQTIRSLWSGRARSATPELHVHICVDRCADHAAREQLALAERRVCNGLTQRLHVMTRHYGIFSAPHYVLPPNQDPDDDPPGHERKIDKPYDPPTLYGKAA